MDVGLDGEGRTWNLGLDRGMKRRPAGDVGGAWGRQWDVGGMSWGCRGDVGGMSCTEKWRDRGYDGDINRSEVQEIWGLEGVGGVGTRA